jgi:hypothetical protein
LRNLILGEADDIKVNFKMKQRACIAFVSGIHLYIVLGLRMSGAIPLLSLYALMTWTESIFYLYLVLVKVKIKCTLVQALRLFTCRTVHRGVEV